MREDGPNRLEGLLLAPGSKRVSRGSLALLLQFIDAVGQVAKAGQHGSAVAVGGSAGVLSESDIAPVMSAVFNGRPVAADERHQGGIIVLVNG